MKPASFAYFAPATIAEALALKTRHGAEARFLAGGQSLVPTMNFRLAQPAALIDLNRLSELAQTAADEGRIRIGALTRHRTLERHAAILARHPLFADALPHVAHAQIRTRGTLGGNLSHADPASELPAVVTALDGWMVVASERGERRIAARDFFTGALTTALEDDELLTAVEIDDQPDGAGSAFLEFARRRGDFAIAGVAAVLTFDAAGLCASARVVLCGVSDRPFVATVVEGALVGLKPSRAAFEDAGARVANSVSPHGSIHASADYQRHLAGVLTTRALALAQARASTGAPR